MQLLLKKEIVCSRQRQIQLLFLHNNKKAHEILCSGISALQYSCFNSRTAQECVLFVLNQQLQQQQKLENISIQGERIANI